jgi:hypothetical protein
LLQEYTKTHPRPYVGLKFSGGFAPDPHNNGKGRGGKERMERGWKGRGKEKGRGGKGRGRGKVKGRKRRRKGRFQFWELQHPYL